MASSLWIMIMVIVVTAIVCDSVVKIVRTAKSGGGKANERIEDLEEEVHFLKGELDDARGRIEVLEKIVTDQKFDLGRQIDDLASNG